MEGGIRMDGKEKKLDQFEIEAKTSGGAVFESVSYTHLTLPTKA